MKVKIIQLLQKVLKHELITGSAYIFIASMFSNIIAFLFNLFLTRRTSVSHYGEYVALMSLVGLATISAQSLGPILVKFSSDYLRNKEHPKAALLFVESTKTILITALVISLVIIGLSPVLEDFLHINNFFLIITAALIVGVVYAGVVNIAFLQSLLKFRFMAFTVSLGAIVKIISGVALVTIGFQTVGALWAVLLSFLISYLITFFPLKHFFAIKKKGIKIHISEIGAYAIPTTIIVFSLSSFTSTDLLLVKHFFSPTSAGIYAGISTVGKVIFYFTGTVPSVMFPLLIKHYHEGRNIHKLFFLAIFLVLIPSIFITAIYFLFPTLAIRFFLVKKEYLQAASLLGFFGLTITLFSIINIIVNFFLSLKQTDIVFIIFPAAIFQAAGIILFHQGFQQVVSVSLIVMLVLLVVLLLYYVRSYVNTKTFPFTHNPRI